MAWPMIMITTVLDRLTEAQLVQLEGILAALRTDLNEGKVDSGD